MSTFVIHLLIPLLLAMAIGVFRPRDCWWWIWVSVVPDLDYVGWILHVHLGTPNFHRALLHNVWILLTLITMAVLRYRRFRPTAIGTNPLRAFVDRHPGYLLAPFYHATHVILDAFQGGFVPFWPFSTLTVYWDFELDVNTATQRPQISSEPGAYVGVPDVSPLYAWLTGEEFAFLLLFLGAFLLAYLYRRRVGEASHPATLL